MLVYLRVPEPPRALSTCPLSLRASKGHDRWDFQRAIHQGEFNITGNMHDGSTYTIHPLVYSDIPL